MNPTPLYPTPPGKRVGANLRRYGQKKDYRACSARYPPLHLQSATQTACTTTCTGAEGSDGR